MLDTNSNANESQESESQPASPVDNSRHQGPADQVESEAELEPSRLVLVGWDEREAELACRALKRLQLEQSQLEQQFEGQRNLIQRTLGTLDQDRPNFSSKVKGSGRDFIYTKYFKLVLERADEIRQLILARQFECMRRPRRRVHFRPATIAPLIEILEDKAKRILTSLANLNFELDELSSARQMDYENASKIFMHHEQQMNSLYQRRLRILNGDYELIRRELDIVDSSTSSASLEDEDDSLNAGYFAARPALASAEGSDSAAR